MNSDWWRSNHPKSRYEMLQHCYPNFTGNITDEMIEHIRSIFDSTYTKPKVYTLQEISNVFKEKCDIHYTVEFLNKLFNT
jgi:hypothetical protein